MNHNPNAELDSSCDPDRTLLAEFSSLWAEADDLWERHQHTRAFHGYVSADYLTVYESLAQLRGSVLTVLEWGSGLGVVTIMASRMGFEAYGIEVEPGLVTHSESLAQAYGPNARFAQGSFIPDGFEWNPARGDDVYRTIIDAASAYDDLDMRLRDFDLVYAFPWPDEHTLYHNIMREFGRKESLLLTYDAREGMELVRFDDR
ncbi:MAG: class I SAM-dependent methyltransferase [Pirellulaceae bacterium]